MLEVTLDSEHVLAVLEPQGALSEADFISAARIIDPFIAEHGKLNGIVIYTEHFPGWNSLAALLSHLHFVQDHHTKIKRVALVTQSPVGKLLETFAQHFVAAEIHCFGYADLAAAKIWVSAPGQNTH
ncbi:STAS/SEC14 domain-containing protein [Gilvimarinus xylanilyticus]|uniref:STAS/SEC14 domain-containing protein n=1 Tax=Gilvimarinus xylanilyticus TaxID=2944139 RepID=A0A9X2HZS9_9GAMM|nr:STAS/SEC14 domain-containing protein [Gilvimarinus xylanilyticus]MCP8897695.1 STAS/SEC14 domain-containing protein [Gilvimarinus xylanilyticus]